MPSRNYAAYEPVAPYFELVRGALGELVDGEHFFDCVDSNTVYEVLYDFPGWPRVIRGRTEVMERFRGYTEHIALDAADHLVTHRTDDGRVVVMEYEVHGTILGTGVKYNNRFCSVVRLENRKVAHWRDYMDSLAAWNALSGGLGVAKQSRGTPSSPVCLPEPGAEAENGGEERNEVRCSETTAAQGESTERRGLSLG